jgi:hypothetical protein
MDSALEWLMNWYASHCDGDWEHSFGISLQSTDNPGWWLKIDLAGTGFEDRLFTTVKHNEDGNPSWWLCRIDDGRFDAGCGPFDVPAVIAIFRAWAEGSTETVAQH